MQERTRPSSPSYIAATPGASGGHAVWSCNEWDPLKEIIVGNAANARYPHPDLSSYNTEFAGSLFEDMPKGAFPDWIVEETQEDLAALAEALEKLGVTVKRPADWPHETPLSNQLWESAGFYNYCPRDVLLVIGDRIVETPNAMRGRYFETFGYREHLLEYFAGGARWFAAPKPVLKDDVYQVPSSRPVPRDDEPIFDAANVLRFGQDLVYLLSSTGNDLGARWLQAILGDSYRVHVCEFDYYGSHIDTSIMPLRPGLLLCNPDRVRKEMLPAFLQDWELIFCPEPDPVEEDPDYIARCLASRWMGMNVLSVRPDLVIVDRDQSTLRKTIERHGIETLGLKLRHARMLGGGFHCATVDIRREG